MADRNTDSASFISRFTEAYNDVALVLSPNKAKFTSRVPFSERKKLGNKFHIPVRLSDSHGITSNSDGSAFAHTSVGSQAAYREDAQVQGTELIGVEKISLQAAYRAMGGVKDFGDATQDVLKCLTELVSFNVELNSLYGKVGIAQTTEVSASGTTGSFVVNPSYWAPGMWKGAKGWFLDIYATLGSATATNTNAEIVVTSVNYTTRTVSFTCASGDAGGLDALTTAVVFRRGFKTGASSYNEPDGLVSQMTTSGTIFNISTSTYDLWKGNSFTCGSAALNLQKLNEGFAAAADGGLDDEALLLVSRRTWADLQAELMAGRYLDSSYRSEEGRNGSKRLMFTTQTGDIEVLPHPCMWEGFALALPEKNYLRVGSTDITLNLPGMEGRDMLYVLPDNAGYGVKAYTDQAGILTTPNQGVWFTDIVNGVT